MTLTIVLVTLLNILGGTTYSTANVAKDQVNTTTTSAKKILTDDNGG
jgi:hypothetical protein